MCSGVYVMISGLIQTVSLKLLICPGRGGWAAKNLGGEGELRLLPDAVVLIDELRCTLTLSLALVFLNSQLVCQNIPVSTYPGPYDAFNDFSGRDRMPATVLLASIHRFCKIYNAISPPHKNFAN